MKEEIKEILDNFKDYEKRYKQFNETQFIIFYRDIHLLLDYINTLEETIKKKDEGIKAFCEELCEYATKLEQIKECINYYAVENDDYSKIYNDEEKELLDILKGDKDE